MKHWAGWAVALLAVLPFAESRGYPHVHDDHDLRGPASLAADGRADLALVWRADLFGSVEQPHRQSGFWRPLVLLSYRLEHYLTGGAPVPYAWLGHVVSLLLHALASVALLRVLLGLDLSLTGAFVGASLFALHPLHAESVAWISGRTDVAGAALAWLGTALLLRPAVDRWREVAGGTLLLGALLCKESALVLVVLCGALVWVRGRRLGLAVRAPVVALGTALLLRAVFFEHGVAEGAYLGPASAAARWFTWLSVLPDLVAMTVWPGTGSPVHPVAVAQHASSPGVLAGVLLLGLLLAAVVTAARRRWSVPLMAVGLWAGTALVLAPWVRFPTGFPEVAAPLYERNLYLAAGAPVILLAWAVRRHSSHPALALAGTVLAALLLVPAGRTRARIWSSDEAFAWAALAQVPDSPNLWNHLGVAHLGRAGFPGDGAAATEALAAFDRALTFEPDHAHASLNRFLALSELRREEQAALAGELLLRQRPDDPLVLDNVAAWHARQGRFGRAAQLYRREIEGGAPLPGAAQALEACLAELDRGAPAPEQ